MSDKIRIGLIGCGGIMRGHARRLLGMPEVEIVALDDISDEMLGRFYEFIPEVKGLPVFYDYREMLEKVELDAVEIATPHTLHFQQTMDCLDAGKHVLLEKPMVCTVDHAHKLLAKVEEKDRVLVLSYQRHYQPAFRYMRDVIREGKLGEVTYVSALLCQDWKRSQAGKWRQDPALSGGGQLNDSGSHLVDIILWTTGLAVDEVCGYIDNLGTLVDINSALSMKFKNGAQATVSVVGDAPCWYEDFTIWGEQGVLFYRNGQLTHCGPDGKIFTPEELPEGGNPDQNLADAILGRDTVWAPPICGLRVIELTEASWKSAELGRPVKVASL
ncbi:MAG: Gfo/Idh/MocA family oxidoreductase [Armatimonadetes bacterium]|nr:Gfo/Idh/MocA family oxidoreductase [Armatimonadota bacterium]